MTLQTMSLQITNLRPHRMLLGKLLSLRSLGQFPHHFVMAAVVQQLPQFDITLPPRRRRIPQVRQRQADVMGRVTKVQHMHRLRRIQPRSLFDPLQTVPDPTRSIRNEDHARGPRRAQSMKMKGHQFRHMIRTQQRAVDQRLAFLLDHLALFVELEDDQRLGFSPGRVEFRAATFFLRLVFLPLLVFSQTHATAVDLHGHAAASQFVAGRQPARSPSEQLATPQLQQLLSQLFGDAADGLLVQLDAFATQFSMSGFDRRAEGHQASDFVLQGRTAPFAQSQCGQFRIQADELFTASGIFVASRSTVGGRDPQHESAQQPDFDRAWLRRPERNGGVVADFLHVLFHLRMCGGHGEHGGC